VPPGEDRGAAMTPDTSMRLLCAAVAFVTSLTLAIFVVEVVLQLAFAYG
jgi:hypothetical protein